MYSDYHEWETGHQSSKAKKFWMVTGDGNVPKRHVNERSATAEAERLAKKYPQTKFYVLEAVSVSEVSDAVTKAL